VGAMASIGKADGRRERVGLAPLERLTTFRSSLIVHHSSFAPRQDSSMSGDASPPPLSVSELTAEIKDIVEGNFPSVWLAGVITNFSRPQSGHCYLTLKDDRAQIRAVVWRSAAERVRFELEDGLAVLCLGDVEVYAPRGTYQLVIRRVEPQGIGALELALR